MRQSMAVKTPKIGWDTWMIQVFMSLIGGVGLFLLVSIISILLFNGSFQGKIYPRVRVGGVDISRLTPEEAVQRLRQQVTYPESGKIVLQDKDKTWVFRPLDLGFRLDPENTVIAAYMVGRQGGILGRLSDTLLSLRGGHNLSPRMMYDEQHARAALESLAVEINRPVIEASIKVTDKQVEVTAGQIGRTLNIHASLQAIQTQLMTLTDGVVPLVVEEQPPAILDASAQAEVARSILSQPLTLKLPDRQESDPPFWRIEVNDLARMLVIERVEADSGATYQVGLRAQSLSAYLEDIAARVNQKPQNARFIFNDETRQLEVIQPAVVGRTLQIETTLQSIQQSLLEGKHEVALIVETENPQIGNDVTAEQLGIRELVGKYTSYFYGSSASRIQNIQTAAARFHGVLVPPGAVFSMAEVLGDVSLDNGYAEALIIYGNRTIKGVGGGVCQVSTTLFRTAFFAGYPIVERHPHAYRVTYYEQTRAGGIDTRLAGLDATVFVPVVDFKFTNDTPYWLLMETYINTAARTLTWKFYSTSDGRTVEWETTGLQNIVEPEEPLLQENPELGVNEIRQVDWEAEGADVTVTRIVYKNGQIYLQDQFITHYLPWRAVYEYGPGSDLRIINELIQQ